MAEGLLDFYKYSLNKFEGYMFSLLVGQYTTEQKTEFWKVFPLSRFWLISLKKENNNKKNPNPTLIAKTLLFLGT